jgi:hypothetical protein
MFRTMFVFAGRKVIVEHDSLCSAVKYARHVLSSWATPIAVHIHGARRDNYPHVLTVNRSV